MSSAPRLVFDASNRLLLLLLSLLFSCKGWRQQREAGEEDARYNSSQFPWIRRRFRKFGRFKRFGRSRRRKLAKADFGLFSGLFSEVAQSCFLAKIIHIGNGEGRTYKQTKIHSKARIPHWCQLQAGPRRTSGGNSGARRGCCKVLNVYRNFVRNSSGGWRFTSTKKKHTEINTPGQPWHTEVCVGNIMLKVNGVLKRAVSGVILDRNEKPLQRLPTLFDHWLRIRTQLATLRLLLFLGSIGNHRYPASGHFSRSRCFTTWKPSRVLPSEYERLSNRQKRIQQHFFFAHILEYFR